MAAPLGGSWISNRERVSLVLESLERTSLGVLLSHGLSLFYWQVDTHVIVLWTLTFSSGYGNFSYFRQGMLVSHFYPQPCVAVIYSGEPDAEQPSSRSEQHKTTVHNVNH